MRTAPSSSWTRRRPEIPFLIVESCAGADDMGRLGLDLSGLENLNRMANTPDPRDFYRISLSRVGPFADRKTRALVASLAYSPTAPGVASDQGGLPETLGKAGFLFCAAAAATRRREPWPSR